jgi:phosphoribosylformimino-5-aminoimidazole carboxamide ribotide isomerase
MRVIPVIDLMNGQVVRGVAGRREEYRPIESRLAPDARPATVARTLVEHFGFDTVYVADLDAIVRGQPDVSAWSEIAGAGLKLWLDAGVGNVKTGRKVLELMKQVSVDFRLIVGLETLESLDALRAITKAWDFPIVSLDLKAGQPQTQIDDFCNAHPIEIAQTLNDCGIRELIVLDLADVGVGGGTRTLELCRQIAKLMPEQKLVAGGGVRGMGDLRALAESGCHGALVASALHDGRLTRDDIERALQF